MATGEGLSMCKNAINRWAVKKASCDAQENLEPSQLNVVTSVFDATSTKMMSATRRIFYMQYLETSYLDIVESVFDETGAKMITHLLYAKFKTFITRLC